MMNRFVSAFRRFAIYVLLSTLSVSCVSPDQEYSEPDDKLFDPHDEFDGGYDRRPGSHGELMPAYFPDDFQTVSIRGYAPDPRIEGNSLEGVRAAFNQGVRFVEIDFMMSADGYLATGHDNHANGDCPSIDTASLDQLRECTIAGGLHIASLRDVLALDFDGIYLDMKATSGAARGAELAVESAVSAIVESGRTADAVIMIYQATPKLLQLIRESGVRAGLKGYPASPEETRGMIERAAEVGFELVCVNLAQLTSELLYYSAELGVWHLPWYLGGEDDLRFLQAAARAGIGGLITPAVKQVRTSVAPAWRDIRL